METESSSNFTEQIRAVKATGSSETLDASKHSFMVVIATVTWLLLSCISVFIYCCNFCEMFKSSAVAAEPRQEEQSEQSELELELEQQSMLLAQVSDVSSSS